MLFMIKTVTHERLKDKQGAENPHRHLRIDQREKAQEEIAAQKTKDEDQVLALIAEDAKISQSGIATKMGWKLYSGGPHKSKAARVVDGLIRHKLVKKTRAGNYQLTPEGKKDLGQ